MKVLVAYYSRTGNTRRVAEAIAKSLEAEVEDIRDYENRLGVIGFLRSGYEALRRRPAAIQPVKKNPEEYDVVVIGSPVWAGSLSSPVRAYLTMHGHKIKEVALFTTYGISEGRIFRQMEELLPKKPIAEISIREGEIRSGEYLKKIEKFIGVLKRLGKRILHDNSGAT
ncbi:MAG: hypothetical protein AYL29_015640 [Candidatus Bathyarchaeota archaeon B24]|nr:MAG: hypothetical protein AYL29_015640 [Candidatus Bathyarchaeota archaeon B24]